MYNSLMKKLAVIFDMDGVLVDTIPYNYRLWHDYLHSLGVELTKQGFQQILGMEFQDVVKVFESQFGINIDDAKLAAHLRKERDAYYQDHELLTSKALPRLLSSLYESGVPLAVATGSSRRTTELLLRKNQLTPFFSEIVTADDVEHGKPSPDIYLTAAHRLRTTPSHCVVVEDAASGIAAAHAAGMATVGYINGFNSADDLHEADMATDNFDKLTIEILTKLLR